MTETGNDIHIFGQCPLPGFSVADLAFVEHEMSIGAGQVIDLFQEFRETVAAELGGDRLDGMIEFMQGHRRSYKALLHFRDGKRLSIVQDDDVANPRSMRRFYGRKGNDTFEVLASGDSAPQCLSRSQLQDLIDVEV